MKYVMLGVHQGSGSNVVTSLKNKETAVGRRSYLPLQMKLPSEFLLTLSVNLRIVEISVQSLL